MTTKKIEEVYGREVAEMSATGIIRYWAQHGEENEHCNVTGLECRSKNPHENDLPLISVYIPPERAAALIEALGDSWAGRESVELVLFLMDATDSWSVIVPATTLEQLADTCTDREIRIEEFFDGLSAEELARALDGRISVNVWRDDGYNVGCVVCTDPGVAQETFAGLSRALAGGNVTIMGDREDLLSDLDHGGRGWVESVLPQFASKTFKELCDELKKSGVRVTLRDPKMSRVFVEYGNLKAIVSYSGTRVEVFDYDGSCLLSSPVDKAIDWESLRLKSEPDWNEHLNDLIIKHSAATRAVRDFCKAEGLDETLADKYGVEMAYAVSLIKHWHSREYCPDDYEGCNILGVPSILNRNPQGLYWDDDLCDLHITPEAAKILIAIELELGHFDGYLPLRVDDEGHEDRVYIPTEALQAVADGGVWDHEEKAK